MDVVKNLENILHLVNINVSTVVNVIQPDLDRTEFKLHLTYISYYKILKYNRRKVLPECPCHSVCQRFAGGNIDGY